jgi:hypothetical protein
MKPFKTFVHDFAHAAARPFMHSETKTFVCFQAEDKTRTVAPVEARDPAKLDIPAQTEAFFFFEHKVKAGDDLTNKALLRDAQNFGSAYYFADRILTSSEFRDMDDEQKRKLTGFEGPNPVGGEDTRFAIDGYRVRSVNARFEPDIIIVDRKSHTQLWPPQRNQELPVTYVPKP